MNTTYKSNNNVVYSCKYHVVWCPKYRRKVLINGVDVRLKELLTEYAANLSVDILEMEIMPDHVHMLLEVDPQFGIHKAVKLLKKISDQNRQEKLKNQLHEYERLKTRAAKSDAAREECDHIREELLAFGQSTGVDFGEDIAAGLSQLQMKATEYRIAQKAYEQACQKKAQFEQEHPMEEINAIEAKANLLSFNASLDWMNST